MVRQDMQEVACKVGILRVCLGLLKLLTLSCKFSMEATGALLANLPENGSDQHHEVQSGHSETESRGNKIISGLLNYCVEEDQTSEVTKIPVACLQTRQRV